MKFELIKEKASSLINSNYSKTKKLDGLAASNLSNLNININNSLMNTNSGGFNNNSSKVKALNTSGSKIKRPSSATAREKGNKIIGLTTKSEILNNNISNSTYTGGCNISNENLKEQLNAVLNKNHNLYNKFLEYLIKK